MKKKTMAIIISALMLAVILSGCVVNSKSSSSKSDRNKSSSMHSGKTSSQSSSTPNNDPMADKTLDKVLETIYSKVTYEYLKEMELQNRKLDDDNSKDILGIDSAAFNEKIESAYESRTELTHIPYSVCLVRAKDGVDVKKLAGEIKDGANPSRFGCLKVDMISVGIHGNYIILISSDKELGDSVYKAFADVFGTKDTSRIDRENKWSGGGMMPG